MVARPRRPTERGGPPPVRVDFGRDPVGMSRRRRWRGPGGGSCEWLASGSPVAIWMAVHARVARELCRDGRATVAGRLSFRDGDKKGERMRIDGKAWRPIWLEADGRRVGIIDQTRLPFEFVTVALETVDDAARAIRDMLVRGAPLIGATAAYGMALAMRADASDAAHRGRVCAAARDAADGDQPANGRSTTWRAHLRPLPAARARRRRLSPRRRDRRGGRRDQPPDRRARAGAAARDRRAQGQGQRPHPLQCRLARDLRLGHGDGADLSGA